MTRYNPLSVFVNETVLGHSRSHSFLHRLSTAVSVTRGRVVRETIWLSKPKTVTLWFIIEKGLVSPVLDSKLHEGRDYTCPAYQGINGF